MHAKTWKVGELARRTQLSVRTLHYYEEIGLLKPTARNEAGHRLFTEEDVERLQRILSLRKLGFSLDDIRDCLDSPDYSLAPVLDMYMARLSEQMVLQQKLYQRLSTLRTRLSDGEAIPVGHFIQAMEAIARIEKYLTPEQIQAIESHGKQHRAAHGTEPIQAFKAFVEALRTHLRDGDDPGSNAVQALVRQQTSVRSGATERERALGDALGRMLHEEPTIRKRYDLDDELLAYLGQAIAIATGS